MSDTDNAPVETTTEAKNDWKDPAQAVAFATLILLDGGIDITEENIGKVLSAAKCEVDARIPQTFQRAVQKKMDLKDLIDNFGKGGGPVGGGGAAPAAGGATGGAAPAAKEVTPEPSDKESSKAGPGLFGADDNSDSDSD
mmetsp:Transcript_36278/g.59620  ORF Transcript_36278/g.59620 Transcript_36278/m.59620 type:complete len:140 (-) Transcript_36278:229-648(-)